MDACGGRLAKSGRKSSYKIATKGYYLGKSMASEAKGCGFDPRRVQ